VCEKEEKRWAPTNPLGIKKEGWVVIPKPSTWTLINNQHNLPSGFGHLSYFCSPFTYITYVFPLILIKLSNFLL